MRSMIRFAVVPALMIAAASCSQSKPAAAPAPAAGTGTAAAPASGRGATAAPAAAPAAGRGGPPPMTPEQRAARRDSIATLRGITTAQLMKEIAGHENDPAGTVFHNVQVATNKAMPAGKFLTMMDSTYGRGLARNCVDCHVANQWASDSLGRKKTARIMAGIVEAINNEQLSKIPPRPGAQPPRISCITCHRGNPGGPNQALLP